jgi:hypothetical protein
VAASLPASAPLATPEARGCSGTRLALSCCREGRSLNAMEGDRSLPRRSVREVPRGSR